MTTLNLKQRKNFWVIFLLFFMSLENMVCVAGENEVGGGSENKEESKTTRENLVTYDESIVPLNAYAEGLYYYIDSTDGTILSGAGIGGGIFYNLETWAVGSSLRQAYSSGNGYANLFVNVDVKVKYAISGMLRRPNASVRFGNHGVLNYQKPSMGGWRTVFGLTQYFLNTSFSSVPFSGLTAGLSYELPTRSSYSYALSFQVDRISNGKKVILPLSLSWQCFFSP